MKIIKALVTGSLLISFTAFAGDVARVTPVKDRHPSSFYAGTVCLGGYLHSHAVKGAWRSGVSLVQLFEEGRFGDHPDKPIKC